MDIWIDVAMLLLVSLILACLAVLAIVGVLYGFGWLLVWLHSLWRDDA